MAQEITIKQLFEDHLSLAWEQIAAYEYPYEVLADIGNIIKKIGAALSADRFEKREGDIWVAKSATVAPTACLNGPLIIDEEAEIRHCAFIRGNVIVGKSIINMSPSNSFGCIWEENRKAGVFSAFLLRMLCRIPNICKKSSTVWPRI